MERYTLWIRNVAVSPNLSIDSANLNTPSRCFMPFMIKVQLKSNYEHKCYSAIASIILKVMSEYRASKP